MNRKASLNLSIEVIIIVVIAFVVLGLGLGFVRTQFRTLTETTGSVQEQIRQQILDDLRTGDKKLSFPISEVTLGKKESKVIALGIKNIKGSGLNYIIEIQWLSGTPIFGSVDADVQKQFLYSKEAESLPATETRVIPVRITSDITGGTGLFKIIIWDTDAKDTAGSPTVYDSKNFFITVVG